jgi:hypothetical protein
MRKMKSEYNIKILFNIPYTTFLLLLVGGGFEGDDIVGMNITWLSHIMRLEIGV